MKLVGYCRVSTDDKGQDPQRQADLIEAWAKRNGHEIVAIVRDEGTSGMKVPPMERQKVHEAIKVAKRENAEGIITEAVDRWTREGPEGYFSSRLELRLRHKLVLYHTTSPGGVEGAFADLMPALEAVAARIFWDNLRRQITSGIAKAKREGWKNGRPGKKPKPNLSPEEAAYVREQRLLGRRGAGWGRMAAEITRRRGALEVVDRKAQDKRTVSASFVRAEWRRIESGSMVRHYRPVAKGTPLASGVQIPPENVVVAIDEIANGPKVAE